MIELKRVLAMEFRNNRRFFGRSGSEINQNGLRSRVDFL